MFRNVIVPIGLSMAISANAMPTLISAPTANPCPPLLRENSERVLPSPYNPKLVRENGQSTLHWNGIADRIRASGNFIGQSKDVDALTVSLFVNGVEQVADLSTTQTSYTFPAEVAGRQMDYYVIHKRAGQIIDTSEFAMKEGEAQNVAEGSFSGKYSGELFGFHLDSHLRAEGVSEELTAASVRLGYKKVVWVLNPDAPTDLWEFIHNAPSGVDVKVDMGASGGPEHVIVTDRKSGKTLEADPAHFFFKVDAAFSGNAFFWDDMLVALATVPYHPWLAESTVRFWLMVQSRNGGVIPREVRKENLLSLWFPDSIRYGMATKPNLTFTNPYLMNWVADTLYRFNPNNRNLALLKEVSHSIESYAAWMETNRSVKGENGEIIGFNGSALGSGADNSRGEVGNDQDPEGYTTAFVDFISQHISMLKDQARWNTIFAEKTTNELEHARFSQIAARAQSRAQYYARVLNERYWNQERGFYFDLSLENGRHVQNLKYTPISGFWALYSGAADPDKVARLIEMQLGPEGFGGDFPFPANARWSIDPHAPVRYKARQPYENEDGYWDKWAHWPSMAMVAIEGLRRSGRPDLAHKLTVQYLAKMTEWSKTTVEENYGEIKIVHANGTVTFLPRAGQHADHTHRPDFAGWGKGPPIYLGLLDLLGINPDDRGVLHWDLRVPLAVGDRLSVDQLQVNGGAVSKLELLKVSEDQYQVSVVGNRPVHLQLGLGLNGLVATPELVSQSDVVSFAPGAAGQSVVIQLRPVAEDAKRMAGVVP